MQAIAAQRTRFPISAAAEFRLPGSFLVRPRDHCLGPVAPDETLEITLQLRRAASSQALTLDLEAVAQFARDSGLRTTGAHCSTRRMYLRGPARHMSQAFGATLRRYQSTGAIYFARCGHIHVPPHLAGVVTGVWGLDQAPLSGCNFSAGSATSCLTPPDVAALYEFPRERDASGQTIGILAFGGGFNPADIDRYFAALGASFAPPEIVVVN